MNTSDDLAKHGVQLVSIKEGIDPTTKTGKMIAGILALFAEFEHETIREQMAENKMARWKEQRTFVGQPPFGYRWDKRQHKLVIKEDEAEVYKQIVGMYVDQRMSTMAIATKLREENVPSRRGKGQSKWTDAGILFILKNPAYYGELIVNTHKYTDSERGAGLKRTKELKPADQHITFQIPPLISKSRWDEIQQTIQFNRHKGKRNDKINESYLRDVLRCEICGSKLVAVRRGDKRYYACRYHLASANKLEQEGRKRCPLPLIPAEKIESTIWSDFKTKLAFAKSETVFKKLFNPAEQKKQMANLTHAEAKLSSELAKKKQQRDKIYALLELPDSDVDEIHAKLKANKQEIQSIESRKKDVEDKLLQTKEAFSKLQDSLDYIKNNKELLKTLRSQLNKLHPDDRKLLVESMLEEHIIVGYNDSPHPDDKGVDVEYRLRGDLSILKRFSNEGKLNLDLNNGYLNR